MGTYKGLDITFGKGDVAHGGILIRALSSLDPAPVNEFIEGPCNCVTKIMELISTKETGLIKEVKDLVTIDKFSLDSSNTESLLYLSHDSLEAENIQKLMY